MICPLMSSVKEIINCSEECALFGKISQRCLIAMIAVHLDLLVDKTGNF